MALLFADAVKRYAAENSNNETVEQLSNKVADFLDDIELGEDNNPEVTDEDTIPATETKQNRLTPQRAYMVSLATEYYSKAKDDIANTNLGNKVVRKKNFKQVMQESFFYGANRFGNNFIA